MTPEQIAEQFHTTYEQLAPKHGYETRKASAVPWAEVPEQNRALMIAVVERLLDQGVIIAGRAGSTAVARSLQWRDEPWNDEPVRYVGMDPIRDAYREAIDKEWEAGHFAATLAERLHAYGYEIRPRP